MERPQMGAVLRAVKLLCVCLLLWSKRASGQTAALSCKDRGFFLKPPVILLQPNLALFHNHGYVFGSPTGWQGEFRATVVLPTASSWLTLFAAYQTPSYDGASTPTIEIGLPVPIARLVGGRKLPTIPFTKLRLNMLLDPAENDGVGMLGMNLLFVQAPFPSITKSSMLENFLYFEVYLSASTRLLLRKFVTLPNWPPVGESQTYLSLKKQLSARRELQSGRPFLFDFGVTFPIFWRHPQ